MTADLEGEVAAASGEQPCLLDAQRARRFLRDLRDRPFIAIVTEDNKVRIYSKGIDAGEALRRIRSVINTLDDDEETSSAE